MKMKEIDINNWTLIINEEKDEILGFICDKCGTYKNSQFMGSITGLCCDCSLEVKEDMVEMPPEGDFEF